MSNIPIPPPTCSHGVTPPTSCIVCILCVWKTHYDQILESAQNNGAARDRLGAALEICVRSMSNGEWHQPRDCKVEKRSRQCLMCKAIRQARKAWKDIYGDSL